MWVWETANCFVQRVKHCRLSGILFTRLVEVNVKIGGKSLWMYKNRRVELPYPNNLFAKWIEEWRVEAKSKGWKSHYNYEKVRKTRNSCGVSDRRSHTRSLSLSLSLIAFQLCVYLYQALKCLKKYPLPLISGEEAKYTIQYCGDKLAKMLDQRLAAHEHTPGQSYGGEFPMREGNAWLFSSSRTSQRDRQCHVRGRWLGRWSKSGAYKEKERWKRHRRCGVQMWRSTKQKS